MRDVLLLAAVAGVGRYLHQRSQARPPDGVEDADLFADALLFGAGTATSLAATKALVRRGYTPGRAALTTGAAGRAARSLADGSQYEPFASGAMLGSGIGMVGGKAKPHWALGLRPRVFVSHAFAHTEAYWDVTDLLAAEGLSFFNHSVPVDRQFPTTSQRRLRELLRRQIRGTSVVMLLAGPGVSRRPSIRDEIDLAIEAGKPVLVVDQDPDCRSPLPRVLRSYPLMQRVPLDRQAKVLRALFRLASGFFPA